MSSFGKAVKKPIPIDWFRWDIKDSQSLYDWVASFGDDMDKNCHWDGEALYVKTREGTSYGVPDGYIIIRGIKGEYYPCEPQIFKDSYDTVPQGERSVY